MKRCDVCNKTSLLPENLGKINICKICFLKINGPAWKYKKIESMHELEKYHEKAISSALKNDFPKQVIDEINNYFSQKKSTMERCDACGEEMLTIIKMNDAKICKKCYSKIESKEWKNKNYTSREQLDIEKNKIIQIAQKSNYPKEAIKFINDTFESKVEKNWMYTIDGNAGQILKVYKDYFSINTTNEFDIDGIAEEYAIICSEDHPKKNNQFSKSDAQDIVKGMMGSTGGLVKDILVAGITKKSLTSKGINAMTNKFTNGIESAITNAVGNAYDETYPEKKDFKQHKGERIYKYTDFEILEFRDVGDDTLGYLKFQNQNTIKNSDYDVLYFYDCDAKDDIIKIMPKVYSYMKKRINKKEKETNKENNSKTETNNSTIIEDIKKFKELLDMGAITQEEYDKKKKQLLDL